MRKFRRNDTVQYRLRAFRLHIVLDNDTLYVYRAGHRIFTTTFAEYVYNFPGV